MLSDLERLIQMLARLPGLGPRSARRVALELVKKREALMLPLAKALETAAHSLQQCSSCGNFDTQSPCELCTDPRRDNSVFCVVADIADLWALERTRAFKGRYHVLGGTLSALDGIGPDQLNIDSLIGRVDEIKPAEVILALGATVDGQTTAHYVTDRLEPYGVKVSRLAHGVPIGGELDYLDDGTLTTALRARRPA